MGGRVKQAAYEGAWTLSRVNLVVLLITMFDASPSPPSPLSHPSVMLHGQSPRVIFEGSSVY